MSFADLHVPGDPFVLVNAWDLGSARALVADGAVAVGTTSLGVAAGAGLRDATREAARATVAATRSMLADGLGVPLTCDLEDGFSDDPGEVADTVAELAARGVAGVNLEDATHGRLVDPVLHARKLAAVVDRCPGVFVNARTDVLWLGAGPDEEALERLRRYADAGAHGVFLPGTPIESLVERAAGLGAPLNVLAHPRLPRERLAALGVARISTGSALYRVALAAALAAAQAVRTGQPLPPATSYDDVQRLSSTRSATP